VALQEAAWGDYVSVSVQTPTHTHNLKPHSIFARNIGDHEGQRLQNKVIIKPNVGAVKPQLGGCRSQASMHLPNGSGRFSRPVPEHDWSKTSTEYVLIARVSA
jgi:hypothetical protein